MGFFDRFRAKNRGRVVTEYKMISDHGGGFYEWDGKLYKSDIVLAAVRPKARAVGKAVAKHIRRDLKGTLAVNPEPYIRFLLEEPNPYMTGQELQEKLIYQLELNGNAFAWIQRDDNGLPIGIYPVNCTGVQLVRNATGYGPLYLKFFVRNGTNFTAPYTDVIHLRKDFTNDEFFGESPAASLAQLMEVVGSADRSIVNAIKNSSVIKWLLSYNTVLNPTDMKARAKEFADNFMSTTSDTGGVAVTDSKATATQITPQDYVPNAAQTDRTTKRIYSFFNTNEDIVQSKYTEDEWISYYEAAVEPDIMQLSQEYTRKLFTRRERAFGNSIVFESSNLQFASMQTKLALSAMVDRGAMTPNEWRDALNLAPIEGGDVPIRRLDTQPTQLTNDDTSDASDDGGGNDEGNTD